MGEAAFVAEAGFFAGAAFADATFLGEAFTGIAAGVLADAVLMGAAWIGAALMETITSDPAWANGWYEEAHAVREGLRRHSRLWAVMGFSTETFKQESWRPLGFSSLDDFLLNFLDATFLPMDPNALLCMAWKWQHGDVSRHTGGDLAKALARITAKMFVMPISSDMFFPVNDCAAEQKLIKGSELHVMESQWGHISLFGMDPNYLQQVDSALARLLAMPA